MASFLFFARVREQIGSSRMEITLPAEVTTVAQLHAFLCGQGEPFASVLSDPSLQIAVNQQHAHADDLVSDRDEIAIFPPVSGG